MASLNKVLLIGHLGADPVVRQTQSQQTVTNLSIATSEKWKDQAGVEHEKTEWHRIVVWGKRAEVCAKYLKKGSMVYLEGKLETKKFTNKEGVEQYSTSVVATDVVFLSKSESKTTTGSSEDYATVSFPPAKTAPQPSDDSIEIPF